MRRHLQERRHVEQRRDDHRSAELLRIDARGESLHGDDRRVLGAVAPDTKATVGPGFTPRITTTGILQRRVGAGGDGDLAVRDRSRRRRRRTDGERRLLRADAGRRQQRAETDEETSESQT